MTPAGSGENNYKLTLTDHTTPDESFSVTQQCATATCADASAEWIVERPAASPPPPAPVQILPLADFGKTFFNSGDVVSGGKFSSIQGFRDGPVYDISMIDDTDSYYLACAGQPAPPGTLLTISQANACPTVAPFSGGAFEESWNSSFYGVRSAASVGGEAEVAFQRRPGLGDVPAVRGDPLVRRQD